MNGLYSNVIDGNKTYICVALWFIYQVLIQKHWIEPVAGVDEFLKAGIMFSAANKVDKLIKTTPPEEK